MTVGYFKKQLYGKKDKDNTSLDTKQVLNAAV